ncbi:MAG: hypothetical protein LBH25_10880 [Fibromonadaceae bacterium]|jgi:hypothetical protein|nr:hypothetical protein [Fibromonadaceae bacterium]
MEKETFYKLWDVIAKNEIGKTLVKNSLHKIETKENNSNFRDTVYSRYQSERDGFRAAINIQNNNLKLDRHKVAAFFYAAFVNNTDGHSLKVFNSSNVRLKDSEFGITHETAFNISCGILESFITSDSNIDSGYRGYVGKSGLIEPELICFNKIDANKTGYKKEALKQIIYAQKEHKLSVALLAVIFASFEKATIDSYKLYLSQTNKIYLVETLCDKDKQSNPLTNPIWQNVKFYKTYEKAQEYIDGIKAASSNRTLKATEYEIE